MISLTISEHGELEPREILARMRPCKRMEISWFILLAALRSGTAEPTEHSLSGFKWKMTGASSSTSRHGVAERRRGHGREVLVILDVMLAPALGRRVLSTPVSALSLATVVTNS